MNKTKSINRLFLGMVLWYLSISVGMILVRFWVGEAIPFPLLMILMTLLLYLPVLLYIIIKQIKIQKWIPFRKVKVSTLLISALAAFLFLPLVTWLNLFTMLFSTNHVSDTLESLSNNSVWLNLFIMAVLPAVFEELIFRGIFYHAYREKGVLIGTFASGLAFGLFHMNINQFGYAMVLGFIFCMLVEITGSIFPAMIAHFAINGWSVLLTSLQKPLTDFFEQGGQNMAAAEPTREQMVLSLGIYGAIAVPFTALAIGVLIWLTKHCKREPHMRWCFKKRTRPEGVSRNFVTPVFAITVVLILALMILTEVSY